jgi:hypothetical protein
MSTNLAICDIVTTANQVAIGHISSQRSTTSITPLKLKNKCLIFKKNENKRSTPRQMYDTKKYLVKINSNVIGPPICRCIVTRVEHTEQWSRVVRTCRN